MNGHKEMKQHALILSFFAFACIFIYILGCESKKDPFSAKNQAPVIVEFSFRPDPNLQDIGADSLKFKSGESYKLHLEYSDAEFADSETQKLEAIFNFANGGGAFSHDKFEPIGSDGRRFKAPATFNDDVLFVPDTSGLVRLELTLTDGVKSNEPPARTSAIFFDNLAPIAVFTARALNQVNPYRFEFNPSASNDRDGKIDEAIFIWNFDDNSKPDTLGRSNIPHEYQFSGNYRVQLRIIDDEGKEGSTERLITTNNQPPVANLSLTPVPTTGKAPFEITYNAGSSFDPDGTIASYLITFSDGSTAQDAAGKHTYLTDGAFRVLLIVRDNLGLADSTAKQVKVSTPPEAKLTVTPTTGPFPLEVEIDATASNDPFGGELSYKIFIDDTLKYKDQNKVTHIFNEPKPMNAVYLIRLRVVSSRTNLFDDAIETVAVKNASPVAIFTFFPEEPQRRTEIDFKALDSFDPDPTDKITDYHWSWGDSTPDTSGAQLKLVIHKYLVDGVYLVRLTVTDRFSATGVDTATVKVKTQ